MFFIKEGLEYSGGAYLGSDLACERRRADIKIDGVEYEEEKAGDLLWERINIRSKEGAAEIGRPQGYYDTLNLGKAHTLDREDEDAAANEIAKELHLMLKRSRAADNRLLVVGLGNENLTPDAVGPRAAKLTNATMHLKKMGEPIFCGIDLSEIATIAPGVMAQSGMEASDVIFAICDKIKPDAVIAIDSLASASPKRLGTTIQISNTGIFPGSGIGNRRTPLNKEKLGVPVIAIGVPTVINANHLAANGIGGASESAVSELFVSPREIDEIVSSCSKIIANGINIAFGII